MVAAAVSVSGPLEVSCANSSVPVQHWHGTLDPLFPWLGGVFHSVPYTVGVWRENNGCEGEGEEDWLGLGVLRTTWDCQGGPKVAIVEGPFGVVQVVQVAVEGGGHSWPPARVHPEQEMWAWAQQWTT